MASKQNQPAKAAAADSGPDLSGTLFVNGAPTVVLPDGARVTLGGELTADQRGKLGEAKVRSLHASGYLQTQEQIDEADRLRRLADENRRRGMGAINPNYGTPSMTPEAAEKFGAPKLAEGARQTEPDGDGPRRKSTDGNRREPASTDARGVDSLGLEPATVSALQAAGLNTVGDVLTYGEDNDGLQTVDGIGDAREREIQEAIEKLDG